MKQEISNIKHLPDILNFIADLSSDEVFTPPRVVNEVLDLLPKEVWQNENLKWLDPCCKTGIFLREIAKRLFIGLKDKIKNENKRRKHILKNMLYGYAITELTHLLSKRTLYYSKDISSKFSVIKFDSKNSNITYNNISHTFITGKCKYCGINEKNIKESDANELHAYEFIHSEKIKKMKFDVIIGNPPYQLSDSGFGASSKPLYQFFVDTAKLLHPRYISMIIPSRWFAGGKGLDEFRNTMKDKHLKILVDFPDSRDVFPSTLSIEGGICYFLWDADYNGDCMFINKYNKNLETGEFKESKQLRKLSSYDIIVRFNKSIPIIEKVKKKNPSSIQDQIFERNPFNISTNFTNISNKQFTNSAKIYARNKIGWVDKKLIKKNQNYINKWKVLISMAYGTGSQYPRQVIGKPLIVKPNSCCTDTYIICGTFKTEKEAKSFSSYLKTKFVRFLIFTRKYTQHTTRGRFKFVPKVPFIKIWKDQDLYKEFNLTNDEIKFIESVIREM